MSTASDTPPTLPTGRPKPTPAQIQAAIGRVEKLNSAPPILARAMTLLRDAEVDVGSIADLVRDDPALAANVIRVSNGAYYGAGLKVSSVEQALQRIGLKEALRLLTLTVSRMVTHADLDNYCITAEDFWKESLFHGLFLEELARNTGAADPAEAYTVGLLRYLGRLAINQAIHDQGGGLFWVGAEPLAQWEQENLGLTHSRAGALLLRRWKFPESLALACEGQDSPALLRQPSWLAAALFFTASLLPQDFDQPFAPVLGPVVDTDFLHPNQLTVGAVELAFTNASASYQRITDSFA